MPATSEEFAAAAQLLDRSPDYKVLRRFVPDPWRYVNRSSSDGEALKTGIFLDVEATGLDVRKDRITQLALVPFQYDALGFIVDAGEGVSYFNDPGRPIPPEVVELTGITDDMVRGQSIDVPAVEALIGQAGIVIAHHAEYDRQMVERAVPKFAEVFWGCSYREVEWVKRFGCRAAKLSIILSDALREFHEAHRALDDCHAAVHILGSAIADDGRNALAHLLESARQSTIRIWARGAPFEVKDDLKARDYEWSPPESGGRKQWYRDMRPADQVAELEFLRSVGCSRPDLERWTAKDRYSVRVL